MPKHHQEDIEIPPVGKNCNLCIHQPVCSIFTMFKTNIEPVTPTEKPIIIADNLAWICSMYKEEVKPSPTTEVPKKSDLTRLI